MFLSVSGLRMDLTVVAATTQAQGLPANSPQQLTHPFHPVGPLGPHTKGRGDQQCRGVTCPTHLPLPQEGPEVLGQSSRTRRSLWSRASVRSRENPPQGSHLEAHSGGKTAGEMEERSSVTIASPLAVACLFAIVIPLQLGVPQEATSGPLIFISGSPGPQGLAMGP